MKVSIHDAASLRAVGVSDVVAYARYKGWKEAGSWRGRATIWVKEHQELLVPAGSSYADFAARISDVLATLATFEARSELDVWRDLVTAQFDVVRVRAVDPELAGGSIPIAEGVALVEKARDMMLAAACAAADPRPFYHTRKPRDAVEYMKRVQLGQTELGSYVVTLQAPIPPLLQAQTALRGVEAPPEIEPFSRSTTRVLMEALSTLGIAAQQAVVSQSPRPIDEAVAIGVSSNLCDAVVDLYDATRASEVIVGISWAAARPRPQADSVPTSVSVPRTLVEPIRAASELLRTRRPEQGVEVSGFIVGFERERPALLGDVTIYGRIAGTGIMRRVAIRELPSSLYRGAWGAHDNGRAVRAIGELRREGRGYSLYGVKDIILDEDAVEG